MKAVICGTTGYTGMVLIRILGSHPDVENIIPVSSSKPGTEVTGADPGLSEGILHKLGLTGGKLITVEEAVTLKPDVVFAALPHLKSASVLKPFFGHTVVIDLSADFRITDSGLFEKAYGEKPPRPDLLNQAVYGLAEIYSDEIRGGDLIANPGCYPTASLLPLIPLIRAGLISGDVIINALSGISGAGKKAKENLLFCERTENTGAYSPGKTHRHCVEIRQETNRAALLTPGKAPGPDVFFTPHLVPLKRGMFVTTSAKLVSGRTDADVSRCLTEVYAEKPFIKLLGRENIPQSGNVWDSNRCDIGFHLESSTEGPDRLFLFSAIDNLMKGASGQAVQNMNIRFGLPETAGLNLHGAL